MCDTDWLRIISYRFWGWLAEGRCWVFRPSAGICWWRWTRIGLTWIPGCWFWTWPSWVPSRSSPPASSGTVPPASSARSAASAVATGWSWPWRWCVLSSSSSRRSWFPRRSSSCWRASWGWVPVSPRRVWGSHWHLLRLCRHLFWTCSPWTSLSPCRIESSRWLRFRISFVCIRRRCSPLRFWCTGSTPFLLTANFDAIAALRNRLSSRLRRFCRSLGFCPLRTTFWWVRSLLRPCDRRH